MFKRSKLYRLREVQEFTGVSASTLKSWCQKSIVSASKTPGGGCWVLTDDQVARLLQLMAATGNGG